jgi:dipeptidyl-peptidase-4
MKIKNGGLLILAFIAFSNYAFAQEIKKRITIEDVIIDGTFYPRSVKGMNSMIDGESYTVIERDGQIVKYSYLTGDRIEVLFDANFFDMLKGKQFNDYQFSLDEKKIMIETDAVPIYRHSYTATYYVYDISSKGIEPLSENGEQMMAAFSPKGDKVTFVRNNNLYIKDLVNKMEYQITFDGEFNSIINGAPDWVYEEEFALKTGFQWSPDGEKIAFYRFDEAHVKQFGMPVYMNLLYPESYSFKYPKAGEENSLVTIHVYDLDSNTTKTMDVGEETDQYIARIKWTPDANKLSMIRLNRLQNKLDILIADVITGKSEALYTEVNKHYLEEVTDDYPIFTEDGKFFIIPSEKDGYKHIYLFGMDGKLVRQLTTGTDEVKSIYGYDTKSKRIYYNAYDGNPLQTAVYFVSHDGKKRGKLSTLKGANSANFSTGYKYFIHFHSSVSTPTIVTVHDDKGKTIRILENNADLLSTMATYSIPTKEFFTFATSEGVPLNGYMVKPLDFNENLQYPVMMYQYSGPGSQSVIDRFRIGWDEYLASEGYLVVCVDGRGTGGRGEAFKKMTYGQLGYYESIDQIETGKYLQSLPFVDGNRIGIWGWSYGGYMSSLCLFKAPEVFSMAIAVAPVTNWRYYDSVYTERFMGLPQDNPSGYDDNSPINHVEGLQGKLLLVHGTADDNVHFQNTIELAKRLIDADKQFDIMIYPDQNHFINVGNSRLHVHKLMMKYIGENL